jgi:hypothetical protein
MQFPPTVLAQFGNADCVIYVHEMPGSGTLRIDFNGEREQVAEHWLEALSLILGHTERTEDKSMYLERVRGAPQQQASVEDFDLLASSRQMSIQALIGDHLLVCYKGRVEVFRYTLKGGITPNASPELCRRAVCDLLADAHCAGEYQDDFGAFACEFDLNEDADLAWLHWLLSWECRAKFKRLLGLDFDLFMHAACAV